MPQSNIKKNTLMVVTLGILTASCIVISMFLTIHLDNIKLTLTFIPIIIAARLYGPVGGGLVAGLSDIIEVLIHPLGWCPLITLTSILVGIIFGLLLKSKYNIPRIILAAVITELIISLFVTTLWLNLWYGAPYFPTLIMRIPQVLIMLVLKIAVTYPILKAIDRIPFLNTASSKT